MIELLANISSLLTNAVDLLEKQTNTQGKVNYWINALCSQVYKEDKARDKAQVKKGIRTLRDSPQPVKLSDEKTPAAPRGWDPIEGYITIEDFRKQNGCNWPNGFAGNFGMHAKAVCSSRGLQVRRRITSRGVCGLYPDYILKEINDKIVYKDGRLTIL